MSNSVLNAFWAIILSVQVNNQKNHLRVQLGPKFYKVNKDVQKPGWPAPKLPSSS